MTQSLKNHISDLPADASWSIRSTYLTVLITSPGAAIVRRDMLFDILYIAVGTNMRSAKVCIAVW